MILKELRPGLDRSRKKQEDLPFTSLRLHEQTRTKKKLLVVNVPTCTV